MINAATRPSNVNSEAASASSSPARFETAQVGERKFLGMIVNAINGIINNAIGQTQQAIESTGSSLIGQATDSANQVIGTLSQQVQQTVDSGLSSLQSTADGIVNDFVDTVKEVKDDMEKEAKEKEKEAKQQAKQEKREAREEFRKQMNTPINNAVVFDGVSTIGSFKRDSFTLVGNGSQVETLKLGDKVAVAKQANGNVVDAGGGNDLLILDGKREQYELDRIGNGVLQVVNTQTGAMNTFIDFERISFDDTRSMKITDAFGKSPKGKKASKGQ
ncbi:MAG: hypothetical protein HWE20_09450 [Gammaproteobacteria bacterium]|nr:hypothetical protein [Gammaproteobacteria bacterium]